MGVPAKDGQDSGLEGFRGDIRGLKGNIGLIEDKRTWREDTGTRGGRDGWKPDRIGAAPPEAQITLLEKATMEVLAACGVPPELVSGGDGTSLREAYRRFLHSTVAPLGRIVEHELREKTHEGVGLSFDSLFAADTQGRARAWRSLVGNDAAMDPAIAARLVGMEAND